MTTSSNPPQKVEQRRSLAIILMIVSAASFATMAAAVKGLPSETPVVLKVLVRNLISLIIAFTIARKTGAALLGSSKKGRVLLVIRSLLGLSGVVLFFYAIGNMALADSALFMRLSPFWVVILAALFLKEPLSLPKISALFLAFLGVLFVFRPFAGGSSTIPLGAGVAALVASLCAGGAYTFVSKLKSYEQPATIVFVFSLISVVVMAPLAVMVGYVPSLHELKILLIIGLAAASGQMFLTYSYRYGKASEVSIFNYMGIPISAAIGFGLWGEVPDVWSLVGALLIIGAGVVMYLFKGKQV